VDDIDFKSERRLYQAISPAGRLQLRRALSVKAHLALERAEKTRLFGWMTRLALWWFVAALASIVFLPAGVRLAPLALLLGYLAAVNVLAWLEILRGMRVLFVSNR